jgi:RimJ/RimL family protein N-acetyltransferase
MFHRSERLLLRPGWFEDAAEVTERISDEAIVRNLARVPWPYQEEHAVSWLSNWNEQAPPQFLLTLPGVLGAPIIGCCGLQEGRDGEVEIGYWIARDWWGQGFATEATRAVLSIARTIGYERIFGRHAIDNPASGKVLRKAGFVPTGRVQSYFSLGRRAEVESPEYVAELCECAGDNDPNLMPQAA